MSKSHVSVEQHQCIVCGCKYDTGAILLDRHIHPTLEPRTLMGQGLCPTHQALHDQDYVALVEVDPTKGSTTKADTAYRTGRFVHVRRSVAPRLFNVGIPATTPLVFIEPGVIEKLAELVKPQI